MPISLGDHSFKQMTTSNIIPIATATAISASVGSSIYVSIQLANSIVSTVVDNTGNIYTRAVSISNGSIHTEIWYVDDIPTGGSLTVAVDVGLNISCCIQVVELMGTDPTGSLDMTGTGTSMAPQTPFGIFNIMVPNTESTDVGLLSVVASSGNNDALIFTGDSQHMRNPNNTPSFALEPPSGINSGGIPLGGVTMETTVFAGNTLAPFGPPNIADRIMSGDVFHEGFTDSYIWAAAIVSIKEAPIVCLLSNTDIILKNGQIKQIQDIERNDEVVGDVDNQLFYQVSRVCKQQLNPNTLLNIVRIHKDVLGNNYPSKDLYITENHPIFYNNKRRPAKCFRMLDGVEFLEKVKISEVSTDCTLYDLQFDVDGSFIANQLQVQSRSPFSNLTPLPRELYLNDQLYEDIRVWDCYECDTELDQTLLSKKNK
jgi:hypothetical protein